MVTRLARLGGSESPDLVLLTKVWIQLFPSQVSRSARTK